MQTIKKGDSKQQTWNDTSTSSKRISNGSQCIAATTAEAAIKRRSKKGSRKATKANSLLHCLSRKFKSNYKFKPITRISARANTAHMAYFMFANCCRPLLNTAKKAHSTKHTNLFEATNRARLQILSLPQEYN